MLLGHYAVALGAKKLAPRTSLGTLIAAAALLDLLCPLLILVGVETVAITPGATAITPLTFTSYPWSHSLFMSVIWGALFSFGYFALRQDQRPALVLFALVVSHWLLDLIVHAPDLPLFPGNSPRFGFGLWNFVSVTAAIEIAMFVVGCVLYLSVGRARDRIGTIGFAALVVLLLIVYGLSLLGQAPPNKIGRAHV